MDIKLFLGQFEDHPDEVVRALVASHTLKPRNNVRLYSAESFRKLSRQCEEAVRREHPEFAGEIEDGGADRFSEFFNKMLVERFCRENWIEIEYQPDAGKYRSNVREIYVRRGSDFSPLDLTGAHSFFPVAEVVYV